MKRRWVPIPVDDPDANEIGVQPLDLDAATAHPMFYVPAPPDDRLTLAIESAVEALEEAAAEERRLERNYRRNAAYPQWKHQAEEADLCAERAAGLEANAADLRAAFQLGEEERR